METAAVAGIMDFAMSKMRKMKINEFGELPDNFTYEDLKKFMKTIEDLPEYIQQDIFNKLHNEAIENEMTMILENTRKKLIYSLMNNIFITKEILDKYIKDAIKECTFFDVLESSYSIIEQTDTIDIKIILKEFNTLIRKNCVLSISKDVINLV